MVEDFDVIVVGSGPAGSSAAREAASHGVATLVLEKSEQVGQPVRCGEFLPSLEEIRRICGPLECLEDIFDLPRYVLATFIERARAYAPSGRVYELDFQGHSIWRARLDAYLARQAVKEGALLWTSTPFLGLRGGLVQTPRGSLRAKVLIGADGPISIVARAAGFPGHDLLFPALSTSVKGSFEPVFEAFFGGVAPGGYAWIIPRKEDANVGLGVHPALRREPLIESLRGFLKSRGLVADQRPTGGFVPMSGPLEETLRGNVLLVGDAAGQVLATSGGGIFTAMVCGHLAGRAAARFVLGKGSLEDYERWWRRSVGVALERSQSLFQAMAPALEDPDALEELFRLLGPEGLSASLRCQDPGVDLFNRARPAAT